MRHGVTDVTNLRYISETVEANGYGTTAYEWNPLKVGQVTFRSDVMRVFTVDLVPGYTPRVGDRLRVNYQATSTSHYGNVVIDFSNLISEASEEMYINAYYSCPGWLQYVEGQYGPRWVYHSDRSIKTLRNRLDLTMASLGVAGKLNPQGSGSDTVIGPIGEGYQGFPLFTGYNSLADDGVFWFLQPGATRNGSTTGLSSNFKYPGSLLLTTGYGWMTGAPDGGTSSTLVSRSVDGGQNWSQPAGPHSAAVSAWLLWVNGTTSCTILLQLDNGTWRVQRTTDSGASWTTIRTTSARSGDIQYVAMDKLNYQTAVVVTDAGEAYVFTDTDDTADDYLAVSTGGDALKAAVIHQNRFGAMVGGEDGAFWYSPDPSTPGSWVDRTNLSLSNYDIHSMDTNERGLLYLLLRVSGAGDARRYLAMSDTLGISITSPGGVFPTLLLGGSGSSTRPGAIYVGGQGWIYFCQGRSVTADDGYLVYRMRHLYF